MNEIVSTSSSPVAEERLQRITLDRLHPHPANANVMSAEGRAALARHISRSGRYPPLVVRPHPELEGAFQLLDGHQRTEVLRELGHEAALCFEWPCDEPTALMLLGTLNRLQGEDVPALRAQLIADLAGLLPVEELALLLPEDENAIRQALDFSSLDPEALLADLTAAAEREGSAGPRLISFALSPEDEQLVERAVAVAAKALTGGNRRGRALAGVCQRYLEGHDG